MASIERSTFVNAPPGRVFEAVRSCGAFPGRVAALRSVQVLAAGDGWQEVEWHMSVMGRGLRWVQRDEWDPSGRTIRYGRTEGDLKALAGEWHFYPEGEGTRVVFTIDADPGVPVFAPFVGQLIEQALAANAESLLQAVREFCEDGTASGEEPESR